ncbi:MAG: lysoplasmalogenase [Chloroflexota bacterium]|nr:MAG: lysoplasmalogenase [Chloroflexota bacterium]
MTAPTILLSGLALVSAALYFRARYRGPQAQVHLFKPLTTALILSVALLAPDPPAALYKWLVVAGLVFSLAGDVFLMLSGDYFVAGWAAFLIAHLVYIAAFVSDGGPYWSIWPLLAGLAYGLATLRYLWPHLGRMKAPAALYMLVIVLMAWQAAGRIPQGSGLSAWLAFGGAVLFVASDSIMTVYRFAKPSASAPFIYMSAYYLAQWLIAMSVVAG